MQNIFTGTEHGAFRPALSRVKLNITRIMNKQLLNNSNTTNNNYDSDSDSDSDSSSNNNNHNRNNNNNNNNNNNTKRRPWASTAMCYIA